MLLSTHIDSQIIQSQEARLLVYWSRPDLFEPYSHSLPHTIKAFPLHRSFCPADAADTGCTHTSHAPPPSRVCAPPDIIGLRTVFLQCSFLPRTIAVSIIRVRRSVSSISGCIKSRDLSYVCSHVRAPGRIWPPFDDPRVTGQIAHRPTKPKDVECFFYDHLRPASGV